MSLVYFLPILLIYLFGLINLFGIRPDLVTTSLMHFGIGIAFFFVIRYLQMHKHFFRSNASFFYVFSLILLIITFFFGMDIKGSRRWLDLYIFPLQTSEIFKVFFIVFLSTIFAKVYNPIENGRLFLKTLMLTLLPFFFIYKQPDLATSIIVFGIFFVMALHSSIPKRHIMIFLLILLCLLPVAWIAMHDYQKARILSFMDPEHDTSGTSYNMVQANIAVGSGNLFGKGLGLGKQSQLSFLPEYHTDFAFSSLVEQFGFIGGFIVIFLYIIFFLFVFIQMFRHMHGRDYDEQYSFYYLLGFSVMMIVQTAVNIGMNLGIVPIAGITLPFVSYGGSSMITFMIAMALIPPKQ
ncbi:rod shape-determining protein RodA [Candidatus Roizmanbacteria bacterium]|nr:MAG: rod shape-determining protein RodA [Candidatus Roizmanbacteria bacterium]